MAALPWLAGCRVAAAAPVASASAEAPPAAVSAAPRAAVSAAPPRAPAARASSAPGSVEGREPGRSSGPCPAVTPEVKSLFARAAAMPSGEGAMAEAVRMHLDALYQHGCHRNLDAPGLRAQLMQLLPAGEEPSLYVDQAGSHHVLVGYPEMGNPWIALYGFERGKIRSLIVVHGTASGSAAPMEAMQTQLLALDYAVWQPSDAARPLLAIVNTHPWMSSCWRTLRFRVLAASGDPLRPEVLLDREQSGRWCETPTVSTDGDVVRFDYLGWGGPWSRETVWRPYRMTYRYERSRLRERFGFARSDEGSRLFIHLAEDWLSRPWALSEQATVVAARERLKARHAELRRQLEAREAAASGGDTAVYSSEVFPVSATQRRVALYCATEAQAPCDHWRTVELVVERAKGVWRVKDVHIKTR